MGYYGTEHRGGTGAFIASNVWSLVHAYVGNKTSGAVYPFGIYDDDIILRGKGQIDFDDMINLAAEKVRRSGYPGSCRYVIVD